MKIFLHMAVALALVFTLVSGLCLGCVDSGAKHECCRETTQAPSCHQPQPDEKAHCECPDTVRILAFAVEAKKATKQTDLPPAVLAAAAAPGQVAAPVDFFPPLPLRIVLPPQDLLSLNSILRI